MGLKKLKAKNSIFEMKRKDFDSLPERGWDEDIGLFDCLVILPMRYKHDSGFRCMDFVAVQGNEAICRLSGCSDVIHIEGMGGYGDWKPDGGLPRSVLPKGWSIDCLPKSGLLRLFCQTGGGRIKCGPALSSFGVYWVK